MLATGDWTHPLWLRELKNNLDEDGSGILKLKPEVRKNIAVPEGVVEPRFLLSTEISLIYSQGGKGRRVHLLVWVPDFETAEKIIAELLKRKANLSSDGRPIMSIPSSDFVRIVLSVNPKTLVIPAHAWTPWFAVFGSMSGFNSLAECFGDMAHDIYAIETGLSSDPVMNWRIKELDSRAILSFSDAHSGQKLGREATAFNLEELSYENLRRAIKKPDEKNNVAWTIEFYPEEGKYHYTGHRMCGVSQSPAETKKNGVICPKCHRPLTVGVMHRVEELANRDEKALQLANWGKNVKGIKTKLLNKPPFVKIVPLAEIIAETMKFSAGSKKIDAIYDKLTSEFKDEFNVLLKASVDDVAKMSDLKIADGISKMREGQITVIPGYDGQFGVVKIGENVAVSPINASLPSSNQPVPSEQISLF